MFSRSFFSASFPCAVLFTVGFLVGACNVGMTPDSGPDAAPGQVTVEQGVVQGAVADDGVIAFKGIPFAAPPVGALRWRAPELPAPWSGVRDASEYGAPCPQMDHEGALVGDEDCLTLNVWTPGLAPERPRPVMVYLHGGAFVEGSTSIQSPEGVDLYDGGALATAGDTVVVTVQYRLGILGLFAHPALAADGHPVGNESIRDQIAALEWVQRNIARFGGDPANVTLFGQSAGGHSVTILLASPLAEGLFARALIQSGYFLVKPAAHAAAVADSAADALGCSATSDVAACLRGKSADELVVASDPEGPLRWRPHIDGTLLAEQPMATIAAGRHHRVPVLMGTTSEEFSTLLGRSSVFGHPIETEADYRQAIEQMFGPGSARTALVFELYPAASYPSPWAAVVAATTDGFHTCLTRQLARNLRAAQSEPVHRYVYTNWSEAPKERALRAGHGMEVAYVFGHLLATEQTPGQLALSAAMQGYWTRFATTGDPSGDAAPSWPTYALDSDPYLVLDEAIAARSGFRTAECDRWDAAGAADARAERDKP